MAEAGGEYGKIEEMRIYGSGTKDEDESEGGGSEVVVEEKRPDLREPPKYAVVLHNDNYTTMEFVVGVLTRFFHRSTEEAMKIMLKIHHEGKGVAGVYSLEIAETKIAQVTEYARSSGYPLKLEAEPLE